jgi:hypothetical protein
MRVGDKNRPVHYPILKPANLPDFLAGARKLPGRKGFSAIPELPRRDLVR